MLLLVWDLATLPCAFFSQRITFDFLIVYVLAVKKIESVILGSGTYFFYSHQSKIAAGGHLGF